MATMIGEGDTAPLSAMAERAYRSGQPNHAAPAMGVGQFIHRSTLGLDFQFRSLLNDPSYLLSNIAETNFTLPALDLSIVDSPHKASNGRLLMRRWL